MELYRLPPVNYFRRIVKEVVYVFVNVKIVFTCMNKDVKQYISTSDVRSKLDYPAPVWSAHVTCRFTLILVLQ